MSSSSSNVARTATVPEYAHVLSVHSGAVGTSLLWEQQLLNTPSEAKTKNAAAV
jgi:hypothetical protein